MNASPPLPKISIYELVSQLGITQRSCPRHFTACFNLDDMTQKEITEFGIGDAAGISKTIKNLIPAHIDYKFSHCNDLLMIIKYSEKFNFSPSINKHRDMVEESLARIVGYLIIRGHVECEGDSRLMKIRESIKSIKGVLAAQISTESDNRQTRLWTAPTPIPPQNHVVLNSDTVAAIKGYLEARTFEHKDMAAFDVLRLLHTCKNNISPPPQG